MTRQLIITQTEDKKSWKAGPADQKLIFPPQFHSPKFSTVAAPGKIPIAGETGRIDPHWYETGNYWTENIAPAPASRYLHNCCAYKGKIYLFGGHDGGAIKKEVYEYDPVTNSWRHFTNMRETLYGYRVVCVDDSAYVISGHFSPTNSPHVRSFHFPSHQWKELTYIPYPVYDPAIAYWNGKIYLLSGYDHNGGQAANFSKLQIYDITSNTWTFGADVPLNAYHGEAVSYKGNIFMVGGHPGSYPDRKEVQIYSIETNTWSFGEPMPCPPHGHSCIRIGLKMYVFFLYNHPNIRKETRIYDLEKDIWSTAAPAPFYLGHTASVLLDNKVYHFCGSTGSGITNRCLIYIP